MKNLLVVLTMIFAIINVAFGISFNIDDVSIAAGDDATLQFEVSGIPAAGVNRFILNFSYDNVNISDCNYSASSAVSSWIPYFNDTDGDVTLTMFSASATSNMFSDGVIVELEFIAPECPGPYAIDVTRIAYEIEGDGFTSEYDLAGFSDPTISLTGCDPCTPPSVPRNLTATVLGPYSIELNWDPSTSGDTPIEYYIQSDAGDVGPISGESYTYTGLDCETPYTFSIYASNDCGDSDPTAVETATTHDCPEDGWTIPCTATMTGCGLSHDGAELGMNSSATNGFDVSFDNPLSPLPPVGSYLFAYFPHPEWGEPLGDNFTSDIRELVIIPPGEAEAWDMLVSKRSPCNECELEFDLSEVPSEYGVILVDNDLEGTMQDLRADNTYDLDFTGPTTEEQSRSLTILVGDLPGIYKTGWNLVSIPVDPVPNSISGFYGDNYPPPCYYFVYRYLADMSVYREPSNLRSIEGYWMGASCDAMVEASGTEILLPTEGYNLFPGANIVGSPGYSQWSKEDVIINHSGIDYMGLSAAAAAGIVSPILWGYSNAGGCYYESDYFVPWRGYWIMANDQCEIRFPASRMFHARPSFEPEDCDFNWRLSFQVSRDEVADNSTYLGVAPDATDGFDVEYDNPEAPNPPEETDYISAYFSHPEWGEPIGSKYNTDVKEAIVCGEKTWHMSVYSREAGTVELSWELELLSEVYEVLAITDLETGVGLDLTMDSPYTYVADGEETRVFRIQTICCDVQEDRTLPGKKAILSAEPNPFNSSVNIEYTIPYDSRVIIDIRDINGRRIGEKLDIHRTTGTYDLTWSAPRGMESGIYFLTLRTTESTITQKIIYMK
mgnify:CR=1 FL=1